MKAGVEVVGEISRSIGSDPKLIEDELSTYLEEIGVYTSNARTIHTIESNNQSQERYLAVILLSAADHNQTRGRLLKEFKNDSLKGQSAFTGTLAEALAMINDYSDTASTLRATDRYKQVTFTHKYNAALNIKKRNCWSSPVSERRQN